MARRHQQTQVLGRQPGGMAETPVTTGTRNAALLLSSRLVGQTPQAGVTRAPRKRNL